MHFFCYLVVKASEIGGRSAVIAWRTSVVFNSYRVIYQMAKEEAKVSDYPLLIGPI